MGQRRKQLISQKHFLKLLLRQIPFCCPPSRPLAGLTQRPGAGIRVRAAAPSGEGPALVASPLAAEPPCAPLPRPSRNRSLSRERTSKLAQRKRGQLGNPSLPPPSARRFKVHHPRLNSSFTPVGLLSEGCKEEERAGSAPKRTARPRSPVVGAIPSK